MIERKIRVSPLTRAKSGVAGPLIPCGCAASKTAQYSRHLYGTYYDTTYDKI